MASFYIKLGTSASSGSSGGLTDAQLRASPVPVDLGAAVVNITGPVTIPGEVEVTNNSGSPLSVDVVSPIQAVVQGIHSDPPPVLVPGDTAELQLDSSGNLKNTTTYQTIKELVIDVDANVSTVTFDTENATTVEIVLNYNPDNLGVGLQTQGAQIGAWDYVAGQNAQNIGFPVYDIPQFNIQYAFPAVGKTMRLNIFSGVPTTTPYMQAFIKLSSKPFVWNVINPGVTNIINEIQNTKRPNSFNNGPGTPADYNSLVAGIVYEGEPNYSNSNQLDLALDTHGRLKTNSVVLGTYNDTPPVYNDGDKSFLQTDANGNLKVTLVDSVSLATSVIGDVNIGNFPALQLVSGVLPSVTEVSGVNGSSTPATDMLKVGGYDGDNGEYRLLEFTGNRLNVSDPSTQALLSIISAYLQPSFMGTFVNGTATTTAATVFAPTGATSFILQSDDTNAVNLRVVINSGGSQVATTTFGIQVKPGESYSIDGFYNLSIIAESATATYNLQWVRK